MPHDKGR
jgi:hypothetical protein